MPNRFYQSPHCTSFGVQRPAAQALHRAVKAEGGWGVVNTEYCSVDPSSDSSPLVSARLWDEDDVRRLAAMTDLAHTHGALAGVELWHGGGGAGNLETRIAAGSVSQMTDESLYSNSCYELDPRRDPRDPGPVRRRRAAGAGRRLRHRQHPRRRVRGDHPALPDGEVQPPRGRVRRQLREPGPLLAGDDRAGQSRGRRRDGGHRPALPAHGDSSAAETHAEALAPPPTDPVTAAPVVEAPLEEPANRRAGVDAGHRGRSRRRRHSTARSRTRIHTIAGCARCCPGSGVAPVSARSTGWFGGWIRGRCSRCPPSSTSSPT